jgi:hypothetical protein
MDVNVVQSHRKIVGGSSAAILPSVIGSSIHWPSTCSARKMQRPPGTGSWCAVANVSNDFRTGSTGTGADWFRLPLPAEPTQSAIRTTSGCDCGRVTVFMSILHTGQRPLSSAVTISAEASGAKISDLGHRSRSLATATGDRSLPTVMRHATDGRVGRPSVGNGRAIR